MNPQIFSAADLNWQMHDASVFDSYAEVWDRLVEHGGYPLFMRSRFVAQGMRRFGCGGGVLAVGSAGGVEVAAAVMVREGWGRWISFQPSQSPLGAIVMVPELDWKHMLRSMRRALPGPVLSVTVTQQDPCFAKRPEDAGGDIEVADYVATASIQVNGSFEEFWQSRGKNLRQNLKKHRKRLEEKYGPLKFEVLEFPTEVDRAILDYAEIESAGWKASEGTAVSADNDQGRFYRAVLGDFAMRGQAIAFRLSVGGKAIAVDFGLRDTDTLVVLKTTYDEAFKSYSPGQLLHQQAFEAVFDGGLAKRIEFYGKVMEWHTRWTDETRMLYHVTLFRSGMLRTMRDARRRLQARGRGRQVLG